nr:PREDICTED: uncharacterized protein LOC105669048 [Linepithema humile]
MKSDISLEKRMFVNELHAPTRRNFKRRSVVVKGYDDLWQADVVEMRLYSRFNSGYKYILTVIDVLGKHAWAIPLKTKGGIEAVEAFSTIFRDYKKLRKICKPTKEKNFTTEIFGNLSRNMTSIITRHTQL